jgi:hypothetical protein
MARLGLWARSFTGDRWQVHLEDHGCRLGVPVALDRPLLLGQSCRVQLIPGARGLLFPGGLAVQAG